MRAASDALLRRLARDRGYRRRLRCRPPYVKLYCKECQTDFRPKVWIFLGRGCPRCGMKAYGRITGIGWNGETEPIDPRDWTTPAGDPICPERRPLSKGGSGRE